MKPQMCEPKTQEKTNKPQRPAPDECCGGGSCCPCVWDEYREALKQWRDSTNNDGQVS